MKKILALVIACICSVSAISQRKAAGLFGTGMKHAFYDNGESPHTGYKSGIEIGGGLSFTFINEGRQIKNQRFNMFSLGGYGKTTDSIQVETYDRGSAPVERFRGTQTTRYSFLAFEHSNFIGAGENPFLYYIVGFQVAAVLNSSTYKLPGYSPSLHYIDPGDEGALPARSPGALLGFHAGISYELEHLFIVAKVKADYPFFKTPEYSMGVRAALDAGIIIPITSW